MPVCIRERESTSFFKEIYGLLDVQMWSLLISFMEQDQNRFSYFASADS